MMNGFDVIVCNPPYQIQKEGFKKSQPIWDKFVYKSLKELRDGGYMSMVHPSGWRSPKGIFKYIYDEFTNYKMHTLSLNDFKKGRKTFGVGTNFDFYCIEKTINNNFKTKIITINDNEYNLNIKNLNYIPNDKIDLFEKLIAKNDEEKVDILYSSSMYHTDKKKISKEKTNEFKYPCIYTITQKNGLSFYYSNIKNEHFNVPKIIWSNGLGTYPIVDSDGSFGLTQFAYGIVDDVNNLQNIKDAMNSETFLKLMTYIRFTNNKYDYKVISTFRKDFWKEFINRL